MHLAWYIFSKRFKLLFYDKESMLKTIGKNLLLIVVIAYSFFYSYFSDLVLHHNPGKLSVVQSIVLIGVYCVVILRRIFPLYIDYTMIVQNHLPVSKSGKCLVQVVHDLTNSIFVTFFFFFLFFNITFSKGDSFLLELSVLFSASLLEIIIKIVVYKKPDAIWYLLSFLQLFFSIYLLLPSNLANSSFSLLFFSIISFCNIVIIRTLLGSEMKQSAGSNLVLRPAAQFFLNLTSTVRLACLRKRQFLVSVIVAYTFKSLILIIFLSALRFKVPLRDNYFLISIMMLSVSPILLFNYVFNNLWGYIRNIWLLLVISGKAERIIVIYIKLILPFLVFDFFLSSCLILLSNTDFLYFAIFYFSCLSLFFPAGIFFSAIHPKGIKRSIGFGSLKTSNSILASYTLIMVVIGLICVFGIKSFNNWFVFVACLFLSFFFAKIITKVIKKSTTITYKKLSEI